MRLQRTIALCALVLTVTFGCLSLTAQGARIDVESNPELIKYCTLQGEGKYTAVGAQVAQPQPAAIGTGRRRAQMPGGIHLTRTSVRRGHRSGAHRRRGREMGGLVCTQSTRGLLGQTRKRFGFDGVLTLGLDGLRLDGLLRGHGSSAGPGKVQHDTQPQEAQDHQLVVE